MMCIVIGLGRFGSATAMHLTAIGHEVLGVDSDIHRVEEYKQLITDTICLDSTEESALSNLPVKDAEAIVVALGENVGDSIITTALLKKMNPKKIFVRSLSSIHETVLNSIGVDKILSPEKESALNFATFLQFDEAYNGSLISADYSIYDLKVPKDFIGQTLKNINIEETFHLHLLAMRRKTLSTTLIGKKVLKSSAIFLPTEDIVIEPDDSLILMGSLHDFKKMRLLYN